MTSNATRADALTRAFRASVDGVRDAMAALFTEDVRVWAPAITARSRVELVAEFERRDSAFSDGDMEVLARDVGCEYACAEWRVRMVHTGDIEVREGAIVPATGLGLMGN